MRNRTIVKTTFLSFCLVLILIPLNSFAQSSNLTLEEEKELLLRIDQRAEKRWAPLISNQENPIWIEEQTKLGMYGTIYQKGWLNPKVSRQIVPDMNDGFLVVDTIAMGDEIITQLATLTSNLLLSFYFPYVQGSPIREKRFTNIRHFKTYKEALLAENFNLAKIPFEREDFDSLTNGEVISTLTSSGIMTRLSVGLFDLLGIDVPALIELGPKVKLLLKHTLKVSIAKEEDNFAIISIEKIDENLKGIGIGLGVYVEDLISLPVSIGIDGHDGYSPLVINFKKVKKKTKSLVYKIDLNDPEGLFAYQSFLKKDFTVLQDLSEEEDSPVKLDIIKEGDISITESNFAINLLIFRTGERNIFVDAKFNTTLGNGNKFSYEEVTLKRVSDHSGFSGDEKEVLTFSTIVPLDGDNPDFFTDASRASFVLDTLYFYEDSKAKGKELNAISKTISLLGIPAGIPVLFDAKKKYGKVQIEAKIRFSTAAISSVLNVSDHELWISLASSFGLSDPFSWESEEVRSQYKKTYYVPNFLRSHSTHNSRRKRLNKKQKANLVKLKLLESAHKLFKRFAQLRRKDKLINKAKSLLTILNNKTYGKQFHKTMVDIVGLDQIMGRGYIRGINF
ncbi:hypothetical protein A9Q84_01670 [Halobacteriovorax marinus]|uniref:Uncharacterized protein n=1 Tax=Halobacteriovorax marinus TaxID=97084 RepID=A0A1Y5FCL2_9BACT|nr:hypothetical protein A9Q84_01670 [Halobacteriovorax marinus]